MLRYTDVTGIVNLSSWLLLHQKYFTLKVGFNTENLFLCFTSQIKDGSGDIFMDAHMLFLY